MTEEGNITPTSQNSCCGKRMARLRLALRSCCTQCSHWSCWQQWRMWCKPLIAVVYVVILLVFLPILIYDLYKEGAGDQFKAWFVAGIFLLLTLPIFLVGVMLHLFNYTQPHLQKHIIRILWIVPIYSLNSWLGLKFPEDAIYWDTVRECYEAYVLYNFLCYLLNYLEFEYDIISELESLYPIKQPPPCCCCPPWPKGKRFIFWSKFGVLQYTVIRILITITSLIAEGCKVYGKGKFQADRAWVYLAVMNGISQMVAIHSLIYFFKGTRKLLKPIHPVGKFLTIKAIVFAIFWQSVLIALLVKVQALPPSWKQYDLDDVTEGLQNFIICVEMLFFAIAHYFVFSHKPFMDPAAAQVPCIASCLKMLDIRDVADDVKEHFVDPIPRPKLALPTIKRRNRFGKQETGSDERRSLLNEHAIQVGNGTMNSDVEPDQACTQPEDTRERSIDYTLLSYRELDNKTSLGRMTGFTVNPSGDSNSDLPACLPISPTHVHSTGTEHNMCDERFSDKATDS